MGNAMLMLRKAVEPEILAEAHLSYQFTILGEVIVKVLRLQVFRAAFKITDVESNVKVGLGSIAVILRYLVPVEFFHSPAIERLSVI